MIALVLVVASAGFRPVSSWPSVTLCRWPCCPSRPRARRSAAARGRAGSPGRSRTAPRSRCSPCRLAAAAFGARCAELAAAPNTVTGCERRSPPARRQTATYLHVSPPWLCEKRGHVSRMPAAAAPGGVRRRPVRVERRGRRTGGTEHAEHAHHARTAVCERVELARRQVDALSPRAAASATPFMCITPSPSST